MDLSIGTFNLNNLFSRFNFQAEVTELPEETPPSVETETIFPNVEPGSMKFRTYRGRLVKAKAFEEVEAIVRRIKVVDADILAVQEVEDIYTLRNFARENLDGIYPWVALIEGNDPRLIDLGILSKLPLGGVTSWQHSVHPDEPGRLVFSRDLLQAQVLSADRRRTLVTIFNNHLKSHFVPWSPEDPDGTEGRAAANATRRRQAITIDAIVNAQTRPRSRFVVCGDMNDPPESEWLEPLVDGDLRLVNGLADPEETRPPREDENPPASKSWTHRFKESGKPARYELFDHVWLSPALAERQTGAFIERRTKHSGDGSDHDPAWITVRV